MWRCALLILFGIVAGCGGAATPARGPMSLAAGETTAATRVRAAPAPSSRIARSTLRRVLKSGLGAFLENVVVDGPVFLNGKFHGFRIGALKGKDWQGVDLKAGDVVTRVNGFTVERPETAFEAFQSLEVASELSVDFERDGEPRSLRYVIVDD